MQTALIFLLILLILTIMVVIYILLKGKSGGETEKLVAMIEKLDQLALQNENLRQTLDHKLTETHQATQVQIGQATRIISQVTEKLTKLDETNKQVINFSAQLQNLQNILKNPKQRGVIGEYFLETVLKNTLPPGTYQMQYKFANGDLVDAAVFIKDKIVPIDSKFSLENYNRLAEEENPSERARLEKLFVSDLKNRIIETSKYIRQQEGTMDFAFMFIPHEAIYYDLLINKVGAVIEETENLIQRAAAKYHVLVVSPTSFLAYLQTVLQGLRALQIEESAKEIRTNIEKLSKHILNYDEYLKKLGGSLTTTINHYNNAYKEFAKIDKDVARITDGEKKIEPLTLDKPHLEE